MSKLLKALYFMFTLALLQETQALSNKNLEKQIDSYFHSFNTLVADFTEEANGHISHGRLTIKKPKFARVEYTAPNKTLTIINGSRVIFYDFKLKEYANISNPPTFIKGLMSEHFRLADFSDYTVKETLEGVAANFSIEDKTTQTGKVKILLQFQRAGGELQLKALGIDDGFASPITVKLSNIALNNDVKRSAFEFNNPNFFKK